MDTTCVRATCIRCKRGVIIVCCGICRSTTDNKGQDLTDFVCTYVQRKSEKNDTVTSRRSPVGRYCRKTKILATIVTDGGFAFVLAVKTCRRRREIDVIEKSSGCECDGLGIS